MCNSIASTFIYNYKLHTAWRVYIMYMVQNTVTYLVMYGSYYKYRKHSACDSQEDVNEEWEMRVW